MRWLGIACLLLASLLPLSAEDWTTQDGHVYHNVTVVGQEDDGVRITYDGGVGKIPYYELPDDIQKRFGQDIDSLTAKRQALDKAVDDAVRAATTSQVVQPPAAPQVTPSGAPGANAGPSTAPAGTAPGTSAPAGTAPNGTPGNATATTGPAATTNKPGQTPGATTNAAPGAHNPATAANPAAHPGAPGKPAAGTGIEGMPSLEEPLSHTPQPPGITGAGGKPLQLNVATYTYNDSLDVCYLDSPPVDVYTGDAPKVPAGQGSSLTLRTVTDGRTPQIPDRFEMTFVCVGGSGGDLEGADIVFNSDTGTITVADSDHKDSGSVPGGAQPMRYVSFYLSSAEVRQFLASKHLSFGVGTELYHIDERGAGTLRAYLGDTDTLEPATSSLMHSFYKLLARIPSFFSLISTFCEYVILISFGLLVAASIAAFILGISRFIKM